MGITEKGEQNVDFKRSVSTAFWGSQEFFQYFYGSFFFPQSVEGGLGTIVAEGKQIINVDGKDYLLEKPLRADVALLGASLADRSGNLVYKGTSQNFNPLMATAADLVIAEVRELVETGAIAPEAVRTPGIFVDYMVAPAK